MAQNSNDIQFHRANDSSEGESIDDEYSDETYKVSSDDLEVLTVKTVSVKLTRSNIP